MGAFNSLEIKNITRETPQAVSLCFEVTQDLKKAYIFFAGQYLTLEAEIDGDAVRRDYSISASPESGDLTVTIKEIEKGLFSTFANQTLKKGDIIRVATPKGRFTYDPTRDQSKTIVAFAAGSGITPIMSIVRAVLEESKDQKCVLIYGNKSPEKTIFYQALLELQSAYEDRLELQFVFSNSHETGAEYGRIDKAYTRSVINTVLDSQKPAIYYLCGPEGMIHNVKDVLISHNVPESSILFELFTASESVKTETIANSSGTIEATILFDDEKEVISMDNDTTILEAALAKDLEVPYSCQGGVCSSCICRITKGAAVMRQNSVLTESEVADGLVLSCQAVPTSATIHIDFDDI
tara:strand:- start:3957 stop:5012 length:1056 start_codon:yes stop_codon:yes gene_type:complete